MVLGTSALLLVAGAGDDKVSAADDPATDDKLQLGVVAIDARIGDERVESSGTVVDPRAGLVVTSAHTVWGATSLRLNTGLGILHGRVVARAPCADLAVIEIQPRLPGLVAPKPAGYTPQATELLSAVGRRADALLTIPIRAAGTADGPGDRAGAASARRGDPARRGGRPGIDRRRARRWARRGRRMTMATNRGGALAVPWSTIQARLRELHVDDRRIYVGWRSYYRCAPQLHTYARREHRGYDPKDAVINAPVPATRLPGTEGLDRQ